jgi:hypothetical protein
VDSLESDSPSLGDNMASPYTRSNRKLSWSIEYHSDTIIVNDLVTSRVRKRTFRFASCSRFDTTVLRVVSGCKTYGRVPPHIVCGPAPCWIVVPLRGETAQHRAKPSGEEFLEAGCWVVDSQDWACIKDPTFGGSRLE